MLICSKCKVEQEETNFSFRNKKECKRHSKCKSCVKKYGKVHYEYNKDEYKRRARRDVGKEREKNKSLLSSLKRKCEICDETWFYALDFHHIDPSEKEDNIAVMGSRKKILEESKKCIVLCANHHRKFHSGHQDTITCVDQLIQSKFDK